MKQARMSGDDGRVEPGVRAQHRHNDPDTSIEAAKQIAATHGMQLVLDSLARKGMSTSYEIADDLCEQIVCVSPRMVLLERRGLIVRTTLRRRAVETGRNRIVWALPQTMETTPMLLDARSILILDGAAGDATTVHKDLVRVVKHAAELADIPFVVTEGVRTLQRQRELVASGASTTLKSRHLTGHAVDLAALVGKEIRWDWPLYADIASAMKSAAALENVPIEWGGDWRKFKDGPHFQLPWDKYP